MEKDRKIKAGQWEHAAHGLYPDDGDTILLHIASFGQAEIWDWGLDAAGRPFERYQWCEDDFYEDSSYRKIISKEELMEIIIKEILQLEENENSEAATTMRSILERLEAGYQDKNMSTSSTVSPS